MCQSFKKLFIKYIKNYVADYLESRQDDDNDDYCSYINSENQPG